MSVQAGDLDTVETADLSRLPEVAWVLLWLVGLVIIVTTPRWETVSFYLVWIGFAVLYGLRVWPSWPAFQLVAAVAATTAAAAGLNVIRDLQPAASLSKVPLMSAMFCIIVWQSHRTGSADAARSAVSAENERLLAAQRRFLQDASHQLKTPITIALGHAELLARNLASQDDRRDIHVVVGELNRLKSLSERLLLIAASENPDFLAPEPLALQSFAMELLFRWRPTAVRRWRIGQLDDAVVAADPDRLALAVDALLENAVQHTSENDVIRLSVTMGERARFASVIIEDSGDGIPDAELRRIFDRFATAPGATGSRGTGLGLALAQAVARGHGGEIRVRSEAGQGSTFEFLLPVLATAAGDAQAAPAGSAALPEIRPGAGSLW
ncbi:MAG TPA: HAMP domain-containing sensor histidine kinase [Streptosporangiaceae bacterium]|nr:HAMP domain-containing sensor histidine kinase [Streptosporangiaceae bacterium]